MKFIAVTGEVASSLPIPPDAHAGKPDTFRFACIFFLSILCWPVTVSALQPSQAEAIPHVNQNARENFVQYIYAESHKAFAIAPGGTWAWTAGEASREEANAKALQRCQEHTTQTCVLYSTNDDIVFNADAWPRLWRLTKPKPNATSKPVSGVKRGEQFPNLHFKDSSGKARSLSDFKGKLTLVHFWGSWCAPCLREMPVLLKLQADLKQQHGDKIAMVLLQVREPFSISLQWARKQQFDALPLYDSGVKDSDDAMLKTEAGKSYSDRKLARAFPSSYVLDQNGRVLFSHYGPITNWEEYLPFFADAVTYNLH